MSSQPVLVVIGIAIIVNLVIMVVLLAMLIARRRRPATANGIVVPEPYRYGMVDAPPSATSPVTYMNHESAGEPQGAMDDDYQMASEQDDLDGGPDSATNDQVEKTIEDYFAQAGAMTADDAAAPVETFRPDDRRAGGAVPTAGAAAPASATVGPFDSDALTGLDGPLVWDGRIRDEDARFSRYRRPISVVFFELDGLDRLAVRLGQEAASEILRPVGQSIRKQARSTDHVARIDEHRFAVLLPETDEVQAINFVERVRAECDRWLASGALSMRLAIGWSSPTPGSRLTTALRLAEDRLDRDRRRVPSN